MKVHKLFLSLLVLFAIGSVLGCTEASSKSPEVTDTIRKTLDEAGFKQVGVSQDREKGLVTLTGNVATEDEKMQAENIAKMNSPGQVVSDQIAVVPPDSASDAKKINSSLDEGIESNLDAALLQNSLNKGVRFDVKNGVVTLNGEVNSQSKRAEVERLASTIPNVKQVVNTLQVKDQKASSTM